MTKYCRHCGIQITQEMRFCFSCGASLDSAAAPQPSAYQSSTPSTPSKRKVPVLIILVSVLMIFLSVGNIALSIVGNTTSAQIINVRQNTRGDRMPNSYTVKYAFFVNGERYTGETTQTFEYGIRSDQRINVRYMPSWPNFNAAVGNTRIAGTLIPGVIAILLLVLGIKGKIRFVGQR